MFLIFGERFIMEKLYEKYLSEDKISKENLEKLVGIIEDKLISNGFSVDDIELNPSDNYHLPSVYGKYVWYCDIILQNPLEDEENCDELIDLLSEYGEVNVEVDSPYVSINLGTGDENGLLNPYLEY